MAEKYNSPIKVDYYDRKGELLKVAAQEEYKSYKVEGKTIWRPSKIHMKNVQTLKESMNC